MKVGRDPRVAPTVPEGYKHRVATPEKNLPRGPCDRKNSIPIENFNPGIEFSISIENFNLDGQFQSRGVSVYGPSWCYREGLDRKFQSTIDRSKFSIPKAAIELFQSPGPVGQKIPWTPRGGLCPLDGDPLELQKLLREWPFHSKSVFFLRLAWFPGFLNKKPSIPTSTLSLPFSWAQSFPKPLNFH